MKLCFFPKKTPKESIASYGAGILENIMPYLSDEKIKDLEIKANEIRKNIIEMLLEAGSGHTAGPLCHCSKRSYTVSEPGFQLEIL